MFTWMRTHQRNLMLVITILTIISFIFFYSAADPKRLGSDVAVRLYDRNISMTDFEFKERKFALALGLGLSDYASQLSAGGEMGSGAFAVNSAIIEHEGRALGIRPTSGEIQNAITAMESFQTNGQFDPAKYSAFLQTMVTPRGFTQADIDSTVANSLVFDRIKKMLDSAPALTEAEIASYGRIFQPANGAAVLFESANFAKDVKVTDDQIAAFFKANAARFAKPEYRVARFVRFPLPAGTDKLEGKAKIDAQQKVADASDKFATQAAADGFGKAAQAAGLKVETTLPFDQAGTVKDISGMNTASVAGPTQALAPQVFTLSAKSPVSGVIESGNEFLVAELGEVTPSVAMTAEEARPAIVRELTETAAQAAVDKAAATAIAILRDAVKSGQPFAQAAAAAGLKSVPFANASVVSETTPNDQRKYVSAARALNDNEITGFNREPGGGYAVWIEKRLPADPKKADEQRKEIISSILASRQNVLWLDWIATAQKNAGLGDDRNKRG